MPLAPGPGAAREPSVVGRVPGVPRAGGGEDGVEREDVVSSVRPGVAGHERSENIETEDALEMEAEDAVRRPVPSSA